MALGVALVALGEALVALGVALAALVVALDGFSWISLVFLGFPWIPGRRGGRHRTGVVGGDRVGLEALSQYPVLGVLDTGYRIQGYRI